MNRHDDRAVPLFAVDSCDKKAAGHLDERKGARLSACNAQAGRVRAESPNQEGHSRTYKRPVSKASRVLSKDSLQAKEQARAWQYL